MAPRSADGAYRRSKALPDLPTFEEFYASVHPGKKLEGTLAYEALRAFSNPQLAMFRIALAPPGTPPETIATLRAAFIELWKNKAFLMD